MKFKEGDWCWFYTEEVTPEYINTHWAIPDLGRFGKYTENGVQTIEGIRYEYCEPFIGDLPSIIKERENKNEI